MQTKSKNGFKAVDFMRQVRSDLSSLYHTDKERYREELKKSMDDFLTKRTKTFNNNDVRNMAGPIEAKGQ